MLLNTRPDLHDLHKTNLHLSELNMVQVQYPHRKKHLSPGTRFKITMFGSSFHWFKINNYQVQYQETNKINLPRFNISLMTSTDW